MRIFHRTMIFLSCMFLTGLVLADAAPPVTEGGFKIEDSRGKQIGNAYSDVGKARAAAIVQVDKCKCTIKVVPPKERVSYVKPKVPPVVVVPPKPPVTPPVVVPPVVVPPAPPEGLKSVKLSFAYPTVRTNGVALPISEIKLCTAYATGQRASTKDKIDTAQDVLPPLTTMSMSLYAGTYAFAMACTDKAGNQGPLSGVVSTTL